MTKDNHTGLFDRLEAALDELISDCGSNIEHEYGSYKDGGAYKHRYDREISWLQEQEQALTDLKAFREGIPDRLQDIAKVIAIEGTDEFNRVCPDDYGDVTDKAAALLAQADGETNDQR